MQKCLNCGRKLSNSERKYCGTRCYHEHCRKINKQKKAEKLKEQRRRKPASKNSMADIVAINRAAKEAGMTYGQYVMEMERMRKE